MLTHQIIQGEIDELKLVLTEKDLTIPHSGVVSGPA